MSGEEWRPAPGFPDYEVSSLGRVKRAVTDSRNRGAGRVLRPAVNASGYLTCTLYAPGVTPRPRLISRLVCEAFHGAAPSPLHHAAHGDGNRTNNRPENLRWATARENEADKLQHGTRPSGDKHHARARPDCVARGHRAGRAKLTDEAVREIMMDARVSRVIAAERGVSGALIRLIKARKVWRHI
jgi:hypothetical protein